jgi:hypothetical protein
MGEASPLKRKEKKRKESIAPINPRAKKGRASSMIEEVAVESVFQN